MAEKGIKDVVQRDVIQGPLLDFDPVATTTRGEGLTQSMMGPINRAPIRGKVIVQEAVAAVKPTVFVGFPKCLFYHRRHPGECRKKVGTCSKYGSSGHKIKECP